MFLTSARSLNLIYFQNKMTIIKIFGVPFHLERRLGPRAPDRHLYVLYVWAKGVNVVFFKSFLDVNLNARSGPCLTE